MKAALHTHATLLEDAVDEWEIAAALEATGLTDAGIRHLRHRDVFSLAEELFARAPRPPRSPEPPRPEGPPSPLGPPAKNETPTAPARKDRALLPWRAGAAHLAPGAACALLAHLRAVTPTPAPLAAALAALIALTMCAALRTGPLRTARGGGAPWSYALIAYALYGPQTAAALSGQGPFDPAAHTAAFTALALSLAPAAYCARWFAVRCRARLGPSHALAEFAGAVRPRLAAALAAYTAALTALLIALAPAGPLAGPLALGVLLFTARLLAVHGLPGRATAALAAAAAGEALTLAAARLGPGPSGATAEAILCGGAALALAVHAFRALPRASAHHPPPPSRT